MSVPLQRFRHGTGTFRRDEKGTIAILFALTSFVVMALVGGAVDYGRAVTARDQMQNAIDSAVLAAARAWQTEKSLEIAEQKATEYYQNNKPKGVDSAVSSFTADMGRNAISMKATASLYAPFLSAAAMIARTANGGPGNKVVYTISAEAEALLAAGGNGDSSLEIAMMLDVTGSMSGNKIKDLKDAAKDLVDIVVWEDQSEHTSRIALIPFANAVSLGSTTLVEDVRGKVKASYCQTKSSPCTGYGTGNSKWQWGRPAKWYQFKNQANNDVKWQVSSYCVTERTGASKYTDDAPNSDSSKVGPLYSSEDAAKCGDMVIKTNDLEVNTVQPLTNDKETLKRRIDKLAINGSTAGQIGSAWAWYMLSPNWAYLWPSDNRPTPYHTEKVDKIAILMSDGEYNTAHCNGVLAKDSGYGNNNNRINCNATNGKSDPQADDVCEAMKQGTGITVYTIGFALGGNKTATETLKKCASDETKFYYAENGDQLRMAFRDIALQVAKIRLSQ